MKRFIFGILSCIALMFLGACDTDTLTGVLVQPGSADRECGNGEVEPGEVCEPDVLLELRCLDISPRFFEGMVSCTDQCRLDTSQCQAVNECGNGVLEMFESCDDGNQIDLDGCSANCVSEEPPEEDSTVDSILPVNPIDGEIQQLPDERCALPNVRDQFVPNNNNLQIVNIKIHSFVNAAGDVSATGPQIQDILNEANQYLTDSNIVLVQQGVTDFFVDNEGEYFNAAINSMDDNASFIELTNLENADRAVDLYLVNTVTYDGAPTCGLSFVGFSRTSDGVIVKTSCGGSTLAHEIGHRFGLYHTFQTQEIDDLIEDCNQTGDLLCDTPYDPGKFNAATNPNGCADQCAVCRPQELNNAACMPACPNGDMPNPFNLMSYYGCKVNNNGNFSPEQQARMRCHLNFQFEYAIGRNCEDGDGDGFGSNLNDNCPLELLDCNDEDATVFPGAEESCDGADNDCDGQINEGVLNDCGQCGPVPVEVCDGRDNDCDGQVDEQVINACGECGPAPEEVCDEIDNDCDGQIDEGVLNDCGECGPAPEEVCDAIDNDCDGQIDESIDSDGDGVTNICDNCRLWPNPGQEDHDGDGLGNECDFLEIAVAIEHNCILRDFDRRILCWGSAGTEHLWQVPHPLQRYRTVSTAGYNTCAITEEGRIDCWGENTFGQAIPPNDPDLRFSEIDLSGYHACALTEEGRPMCWGYQGRRISPPDELPEGGFVKISSGGGHSCALTQEGRIVCWGNTRVPARHEEEAFVDMMASGNQTCVITEAQTLLCWGELAVRNFEAIDQTGEGFVEVVGEMGSICAKNASGFVFCFSSTGLPSEPFGEAQLDGIDANYSFLDLEGHRCGFDALGQILCWGTAGNPQPIVPENIPQAGYQQVSASDGYTCALTEEGQAHCWGGNVDGPPENSTYRSIAVGPDFGCAINANQGIQNVECWGTLAALIPGDLPAEEYVEISAGDNHACARSSLDHVVCWGENDFGETIAPQEQLFEAISTGSRATCGIRSDVHQLQCWGNHPFRPFTEPPEDIPNLERGRLSVTEGFGCALSNVGRMMCWGDISSNAISLRDIPNDRPNQGYRLLSTASQNACAIDENQQIVCWGHGRKGENIHPSVFPNAEYTWLSTGEGYTCGIRGAAGELHCWGSNGTGAGYPHPMQVEAP